MGKSILAKLKASTGLLCAYTGTNQNDYALVLKRENFDKVINSDDFYIAVGIMKRAALNGGTINEPHFNDDETNLAVGKEYASCLKRSELKKLLTAILGIKKIDII